MNKFVILSLLVFSLLLFGCTGKDKAVAVVDEPAEEPENEDVSTDEQAEGTEAPEQEDEVEADEEESVEDAPSEETEEAPVTEPEVVTQPEEEMPDLPTEEETPAEQPDEQQEEQTAKEEELADLFNIDKDKPVEDQGYDVKTPSSD